MAIRGTQFEHAGLGDAGRSWPAAGRSRSEADVEPIDPFCWLPPSVEGLFRNAQREAIPVDTVLGAPGEPCDAMFVLFAGEIWVRRIAANSEQLAAVALLAPGDTYGSHSVQKGSRHAFVVQARTPCIVSRVAGDVVGAVLDDCEASLLAALAYPAVRVWLRPLLRYGASPAALKQWLLAARRVELSGTRRILSRGELRGNVALVLSGSARHGERRLIAGDAAGLEAAAIAAEPRRDVEACGAADLLLLPLDATAPAEVHEATRAAWLEAAATNPTHAWCGPTDVAPIDEPDVNPDTLDAPLRAQQPSVLRRVPHVFQRTRADCGVACLCMLLEAHDVVADYEQVRTRARVSRYGTSLHDLQAAAEDLGFRTAALRVGFDDIRALALPAIAYLPKKKHYVVIWRASRRTVVISDPGQGRLRRSKAAFTDEWDGVVMSVSPTVALRRKALELPQRPRWAWLGPLLRRHRAALGAVATAALGIEAFGLLTPLVTQTIVDFVIPSQSASLLTVLATALCVMHSVTCMLELAKATIVAHVSSVIEGGLLDDLYALIVRGRGGLLERYGASDLLARFGDVTAVRDFLANTALVLGTDLLVLVPASLIIVTYDARLAALFALVAGVTVLATLLLSRVLRFAAVEHRTHYDRYRQHVLDSLNGNDAIVYQGLQREFISWGRRLLQPLSLASRRLSWTSHGGAAVVGAVNAIGATIVFWCGVRAVLAQSLSLGEFIAFGMLSSQISAPVLRLVQEWATWQKTSLSFSRISDLVQPTVEPEQRLRLRPDTVRGEITFSDVDFAYTTDPKDADRPVLQNVTLRITPGEVVGIVGRSGSGKSTLVRLCLGLLQPQNGAVSIDGLRTTDIDPEFLTRNIGYVSQTSHLFAASVYFNIACGRDVTLEDVARAAALAGAYEFISELPFGFSTMLGERGRQLSGGQKQRVLLARALVGDPALLVLDEATAGLDAQAEQAIFSRLEDFSRGRTTLIITHRLATLRHVNRVLMLDSGRLCDDGSPADLARAGGMFQRFASSYTEWSSP